MGKKQHEANLLTFGFQQAGREVSDKFLSKTGD